MLNVHLDLFHNSEIPSPKPGQILILPEFCNECIFQYHQIENLEYWKGGHWNISPGYRFNFTFAILTPYAILN
jgi:hypothetical protein